MNFEQDKVQKQLEAANRRVWLRVGTLLDGVSPKPIRDAHVVYDSRQILFVSAEKTPPADLLNPSQTKPDAELPDHTLLPGLIEAHAHLFLEGGELNLDKRAAYLKQAPDKLLKAAMPRLEKLVRLGVIAVRDAGDKDGVGLALSKLYMKQRAGEATPSSPNHPSFRGIAALPSPCCDEASQLLLMPYLDSPGAAIHHKGRYGSFMGEPVENYPSLRACVESRVKAGADRIKLIPTGIINFQKGAVTSEPQMTTDEIRELVAAANSFRKQTFAHASGDVGIERVIDAGVDSVEHGFFVRDDQLAKMRDRRIAWVPTFAPVQEQVDHADQLGWQEKIVSNLKKILDQHSRSLVKAHEMGVQIIAGSDAGSVGVAHGLGFLHELELMERAGLSPIAVINAATGASSNRLRFKEKFGQIKPGYLSRIIITRHSPLARITNLMREKWIIFDGQTFGQSEEIKWEGL